MTGRDGQKDRCTRSPFRPGGHRSTSGERAQPGHAWVVAEQGGEQEEATIVKRPVLVVRNSTERPGILGTFAHLVAAGPQIWVLAKDLLGRLPEVHAHLEALPYPYGTNATAAVVAAIDELVG